MTWQVKQGVNFYTEEFKPAKMPQPLRQLLQLLLLCALLMMAAGIALALANSYQQSQQHSLQQQLQSLQLQQQQLAQSQPSQRQDSDLLALKRSLQQEVRAQGDVLRFLSQGKLQQSLSFTPLVAALAEQQVEGVWLSGFRFEQGGERIALHGLLTRPQQLSQYVQTLLARPAYQQRAFRFIDIQPGENKKASAALNFTLSSHPPLQQQQQNEDDDSLISPLFRTALELKAMARSANGSGNEKRAGQ